MADITLLTSKPSLDKEFKGRLNQFDIVSVVQKLADDFSGPIGQDNNPLGLRW